MKISVLIPYKPDHGWRDFLWKNVEKRYKLLMPQLELCLGLDESELFSRARAINKAARKARGDLFIIADSDVIFNPDLITKIKSYIHLYPWIIPFKIGYRLTYEATMRLLEQKMPKKIKIGPQDIINKNLNRFSSGSLMNAMTRSTFEAVSGFDERFQGWGCEDRAFAISMNTICGNYFKMDETIYHLWHKFGGSTKTPEYKRNLALLDQYKAANHEVEKMKKLIKERSVESTFTITKKNIKRAK